ncbi:hypothetical protein TNCV_4701181 [Trichonephila clavipes]|nr:hypothetical protein TNCV_4701181 [Trichonephila clavipes]
MKQFGKTIPKDDDSIKYLSKEFPGLSETKLKEEILIGPDIHKLMKDNEFGTCMTAKEKERILFSDEAHFWLNGYVNKQNCRIWSEASPQVYVETTLHPEKLTVGCALWAGGIRLQKR